MMTIFPPRMDVGTCGRCGGVVLRPTGDWNGGAPQARCAACGALSPAEFMAAEPDRCSPSRTLAEAMADRLFEELRAGVREWEEL